MKIKIIDLFNKIANNEKVPKHILLTNIVFHYDDDVQVLLTNTVFHYDDDVQDYENDSEYLFRDSFSNFDRSDDFLNIEVEEVEIIEEEKEIEKLGKKFTLEGNTSELTKSDWQFSVISQKINELVDEINKLKKEKK